MDIDRYHISPGKKVRLEDWDPDEKSAFDGEKADAQKELVRLTEKLEELQELLYAEGKRKVLVVLQGMDTSGKDGVIRHVFEGVNPQGVKVASFKVPTAPELAHDYLWRVHPQVPAKGELVIFNRSHYEEVLVVRVLKLAPKKVWERHYQQINDFEQMLTQEGTTILKFFLHISLEEQRQRLLDRLDQPASQWKFNPGDLDARAQWDDYMKAYEDALSRTSTKWAPWTIVPANRKWYRNLVIGTALVDALKGLKMQYPKPVEDLDKYRAALGGEAPAEEVPEVPLPTEITE